MSRVSDHGLLLAVGGGEVKTGKLDLLPILYTTQPSSYLHIFGDVAVDSRNIVLLTYSMVKYAGLSVRIEVLLDFCGTVLSCRDQTTTRYSA